MTDPLHDLVLPRLTFREESGGYRARCPAHDDAQPSLSIRRGDDHPVIFKCQAGCNTEDILKALDLTWSDVLAPREQRDEIGEWTPAGTASEVYDYRDEFGHLLFQVLRVPQPDGKKSFRQRVPDAEAKSGWRWKLDDTRRVPYRLPELLDAVEEGREVYIVEGERDVATLVRHGIAATCNSGGAGKWRAEWAPMFAEAHVTIVADRDAPGQAHARDVAAALASAATLRIVEAAEGKDVTDHLSAGRTLDELVLTWTREPTAAVDLAPDLHEFLDVVDPPAEWVIPGLMERSERLIWVGVEGGGKSTFTRMMAVAAACGVHPFTDEWFDPQRVLFVDCENTERQGRRNFRRLRDVAAHKGRPVPRGQMHLIHRPAGIDLARPSDAAWFAERVTAHTPDLVVIGPFYKLHASEKEDEASARAVTTTLDAILRDQNDCAVIIEHHVPHGDAKHRELRPFGSSLLRRWPEMGIGLKPTSDDIPCPTALVKRFRPDREPRAWPRALRWGNGDRSWPWVIDEEHAKEWG